MFNSTAYKAKLIIPAIKNNAMDYLSAKCTWAFVLVENFA